MVHRGPNVNRGHWYALIKQQNTGKWYKQDDLQRRSIPLSLDQVKKEQPMSLFYLPRKDGNINLMREALF